MSSSAILNKLKDLDGYPKTLDDYRVRTLGGGTDITEELFVDTTREPKLQINLNITVPAISCKYLSVDAMDSSGEQHFQIEHNIYKMSLDKNGNPVNQPQKEELIKSISETPKETKCGSCYGAESEKFNITCCNTCADVKDAYMKRGWSFNNPDQIEQCKNLNQEYIFNEGCYIYGSMEVNRVGGSFHIAPGQSFSINHIHFHNVQPFSSTSFNTSHRIDHLSFGVNIPGKTNPLDGLIAISPKGATMFQYYIKIVPTIYYYNHNGRTILTNQFSVTRHQKSESDAMEIPPGVFFNYELAPVMVKYTEKKRSFGHFATNVCAIIGGVFTVASLIDGFLYRSVQVFQQKIEIGKVY